MPRKCVECRRCGNKLGEEVAGYVAVCHRGREWLGVPTAIKCEECGTVWRPAPETIERVVRPVADGPAPTRLDAAS